MTKSELIQLAAFEGNHIRKILHEGEWWFSVIDIVEVLTGSERPRKYWSDLKKKLLQEGYDQLSEKIGQLKLQSSDGKFYATDCANTETMFRIIQSIPSPKVEPLKRWLAKVGKERIDEIENPELSMERMQALYEKKGYPALINRISALTKFFYANKPHKRASNLLKDGLTSGCAALSFGRIRLTSGRIVEPRTAR
jgi:DNA-damage-inducible protein D